MKSKRLFSEWCFDGATLKKLPKIQKTNTFLKEKIIKTALKTLEIEAETISRLKVGIDNDFLEIVERIGKSTGRVIVTGIGKSALVAQKIVATLNSTGTPSFFMHAADAIHGDLGMIMPKDNLICISKSGETPEIKVLVPLLKNLGNLVIGMCGNKKSFLAKQADYLLFTPVAKEADPNNLAPTASTAAQMAMGDALAMSLLTMKGFTREDFAQFHPGGSLGKQLYLRVFDLFLNNEKPAVAPDATIRQIILEISSKRLGATAVIGFDNQLLGIITDGDLRRMMQQKEDLSSVLAKEIMTPSPHSVESDELAIKALQKMRKFSITQLVVTKNEEYVGILHLHDLLREGLV